MAPTVRRNTTVRFNLPDGSECPEEVDVRPRKRTRGSSRNDAVTTRGAKRSRKRQSGVRPPQELISEQDLRLVPPLSSRVLNPEVLMTCARCREFNWLEHRFAKDSTSEEVTSRLKKKRRTSNRPAMIDPTDFSWNLSLDQRDERNTKSDLPTLRCSVQAVYRRRRSTVKRGTSRGRNTSTENGIPSTSSTELSSSAEPSGHLESSVEESELSFTTSSPSIVTRSSTIDECDERVQSAIPFRPARSTKQLSDVRQHSRKSPGALVVSSKMPGNFCRNIDGKENPSELSDIESEQPMRELLNEADKSTAEDILVKMMLKDPRGFLQSLKDEQMLHCIQKMNERNVSGEEILQVLTKSQSRSNEEGKEKKQKSKVDEKVKKLSVELGSMEKMNLHSKMFGEAENSGLHVSSEHQRPSSSRSPSVRYFSTASFPKCLSPSAQSSSSSCLRSQGILSSDQELSVCQQHVFPCHNESEENDQESRSESISNLLVPPNLDSAASEAASTSVVSQQISLAASTSIDNSERECVPLRNRIAKVAKANEISDWLVQSVSAGPSLTCNNEFMKTSLINSCVSSGVERTSVVNTENVGRMIPVSVLQNTSFCVGGNPPHRTPAAILREVPVAEDEENIYVSDVKVPIDWFYHAPYGEGKQAHIDYWNDVRLRVKIARWLRGVEKSRDEHDLITWNGLHALIPHGPPEKPRKRSKSLEAWWPRNLFDHYGDSLNVAGRVMECVSSSEAVVPEMPVVAGSTMKIKRLFEDDENVVAFFPPKSPATIVDPTDDYQDILMINDFHENTAPDDVFRPVDDKEFAICVELMKTCSKAELMPWIKIPLKYCRRPAGQLPPEEFSPETVDMCVNSSGQRPPSFSDIPSTSSNPLPSISDVNNYAQSDENRMTFLSPPSDRPCVKPVSLLRQGQLDQKFREMCSELWQDASDGSTSDDDDPFATLESLT
ncbi:hypothetical protein AB6A40_005361 [Gnathostoma spinigerum]|uniref:Uncharacterized protein n=1 Tax=Gnathostoma spinigerum TaxID=75299 RepID=A0ABD6EQ20_9BILA